jgi:hypothetical protein
MPSASGDDARKMLVWAPCTGVLVNGVISDLQGGMGDDEQDKRGCGKGRP